MAPAGSLPEHPELAALAHELDRLGSAADILDSKWRLAWVSRGLKALLGEYNEGRLGYGLHLLEAFTRDPWVRSVTLETLGQLFSRTAPYWIASAPPELLSDFSDRFAALAERLSLDGTPAEIPAQQPPPAWTHELGFLQGDLDPVRVRYLGVRLHDVDGRFIGVLESYTSALPPHLLTLLVRGDEPMFERMASLVEPGRHAAAILFADLQASGELSRRLSSAAYFRLMRAITTALDDAVIGCGGIVGKHAGDGVSAFFLADQLGSHSAAARAALATARAIPAAVERAADAEPNLRSEDCPLNVGVHWGPTLYMGQVVTGGRLEVTALGDEVNEAARIQQSARDGQLLASKEVIEQLEPDEAKGLGIDQDEIAYRPVRDLEGADEKALRDAGSVAVTELEKPEPVGIGTSRLVVLRGLRRSGSPTRPREWR